jgi:hypothetical protein
MLGVVAISLASATSSSVKASAVSTSPPVLIPPDAACPINGGYGYNVRKSQRSGGIKACFLEARSTCLSPQAISK